MATVRASGVTADVNRRACERVLATARKPPAPDRYAHRQCKHSQASADQQRCKQPHGHHRSAEQPERHGGSQRTPDRLGGDEEGAVPATATPAATLRTRPSRADGAAAGEGFDRSHPSCATTGDVRRDLTRQQRHADGDDHRDPTGIDLERPGQQPSPLHGFGEPRREPQTRPHAERGPHTRHDQRLACDQAANLSRRGAHRSQQGDLAVTLLHEQRQHSCDHEHGDEQSDASE